MNKKKIFFIDTSLNSEETLIAYAKMWHRLAGVNMEILQSELKIAKDKAELIEILTKYYGHMVEFYQSDCGDY